MITGIALVVGRHLLLALIPLAAMALIVAVDGLIVMCEVGMVAVLGGIWRYADQHQKKDLAVAALRASKKSLAGGERSAVTVSRRGRAFVVHGLDWPRAWPSSPNTAAMRRGRDRLRRS